MENGRKILVKTTVREYISAIGGIETIEKKDRMTFIKKIFFIVNELDKNRLLDKVNYLFPTGVQFNNQLLPPINLISLKTTYPLNDYDSKPFKLSL